MRQKNYNVAALTFLVVIMLTAGCGQSREEIKKEIIGRYFISNSEYYPLIQFNEDNTLFISERGHSAKGSWEIMDNGKFKMVISNLGETEVTVGELNFNEEGFTVKKSSSDIIRFKKPEKMPD